MRSLKPRSASPWPFLAVAILAAPPLLFSTFLPSWAPLAAAGLLAVAYLLRSLALGRLVGQTPADWALLLILVTLPVGLWASANHAMTLPRTYAFLANLGLFWALAGLASTPRLKHLAPLLALGGVALGIALMLGTTASGGKLPFINRDIYSLLPRGFRPFWNPAGFNPNLVGGMIALFWPLALAAGLHARTFLGRVAALAGVAILGGLLLLAQSRGALIGIALATLAVLMLSSRRWWWIWAVGVVVAAIGLALTGAPITFDAVLGTSDILGASSLQGRLELWSRALYMIQDFSFTGVGLGMFEPVVKLLYPTFSIGPDAEFLHAHNIFLNVAAEMGLPGLIGHLSLYLVLGGLLLRQALAWGASPVRPLAIGLFGTLLAFLIHGQFEVITMATRAAILVWGLFGLMAAAGMAPRAESSANTGASS